MYTSSNPVIVNNTKIALLQAAWRTSPKEQTSKLCEPGKVSSGRDTIDRCTILILRLVVDIRQSHTTKVKSGAVIAGLPVCCRPQTECREKVTNDLLTPLFFKMSPTCGLQLPFISQWAVGIP